MEYALIIIGFFIIITSYGEAQLDNSILSGESLKTFLRTITGGYIIGSVSILIGSAFICISYLGI
ncbi:MAG: hypothetical protein E6845_17370 [Clostridium sp.]|uniref:hypothetical protein n=1 Tax=Clostridium sp. TaxID=1506 RepID=UPI002902C9BE|nr:hypothetical protein [Clostridium sp.]MDU1604730.1 hypothetical protein [Clostridium sp.]